MRRTPMRNPRVGALQQRQWSRTVVGCVALCFSLLLFAEKAHSQQPPTGKRSPLTSIGVVQEVDAPRDPDDPGAGGGFDAENYFQNILVGKVGECKARVLKAFLSWSNAQALSVPKTVEQPMSLLAFTTLATPPGVLELNYRFSPALKRSRATLFFYSVDGAQHEPPAIEALLNQYNVATLQNEMRTAVACQ